jgi:NADH-quinone oxidoreductase subunit N
MNTIILSAILGVVMMFSGIFIKNKSAMKYIAAAGFLLLLLANIGESNNFSLLNIDTNGMLHTEKFGLMFNSICIAATLLFILLSGSDIEKVGNHTAEYFALLFFITCGIGIVMAYQTLLMLFIGIEVISIPLYILTGSDKRNLKSNEAALKYFLMGSFSTGIMLMGIALMYGANGSFNIEKVASVMPGVSLLEASGLLLLLVAMSFKVSAAPFHFWTPDVYDGAPTVFTSYMATVVKVAGFVGFIRLFEGRFGSLGGQWQILIGLMIIATLAVGNLTAVFQQSVKRMLAYSSIAQAGFMLFALYAFNEEAKEGMILYGAAYCLATIGIFAILAKMDDYSFDGYNGLAKSQPLLAGVNTVFLLSLAGIPLTAGFFSKYYMLAAAVRSGRFTWIVIVAVIFAAISAYYYFRVIQAMYFKEGDVTMTKITPAFKLLLVLTAALIILFGIFPNALLQFYYF